MSKNVFLNIETRNDTSSLASITMSETRDPVVLQKPEDYEVAIDRFSIHKAFLPIFEDEHDLKVKIIRKSDSATNTDTCDFSSVVDSDGLMYNYAYFVNIINASIDACLSALSLTPGDVFVSVANTGVATLDYSAIANFGDLYYLEFNQPLYGIFSTLDYADVISSQEFYRLNTVNTSPYTLISAESVNICPVDKIYIKSNRMPIVSEYSPALVSGQASRNSEAILTDFNFNSETTIFPLNNINFTSISGQYRFHSMDETSAFNTCDLQFYYSTYANNSFELKIQPSGSCNVKLYFRKIK